jgi:hypothetical protein
MEPQGFMSATRGIERALRKCHHKYRLTHVWTWDMGDDRTYLFTCEKSCGGPDSSVVVLFSEFWKGKIT